MNLRAIQSDVTKLPDRDLGQMQRWAAKSNPNLHREYPGAFHPLESPHQVNAGARVQPVRCHCASAPNCAALRRFGRDGFSGAGLIVAIFVPVGVNAFRLSFS